MTIRVALLDMDGTIWDSPIDWLAVRHEIDLPVDGRPIYMQLMDLPPQERGRGIQILERYEALGVENGTLVPGTEELLRSLRDARVKCALITNNSRRSVERVLGRYPLSFDLVLSRDDGALKPDPRAFLSALEQLGARPDEALAIGDAHLDLIAAARARIREFILVGSKPWVRDLLPVGLPHHKAVDLVEARAIVTRLLEPTRR
jgi:HAD superfamily hydrolase (TIGR01549 family)